MTGHYVPGYVIMRLPQSGRLEGPPDQSIMRDGPEAIRAAFERGAKAALDAVVKGKDPVWLSVADLHDPGPEEARRHWRPCLRCGKLKLVTWHEKAPICAGIPACTPTTLTQSHPDA